MIVTFEAPRKMVAEFDEAIASEHGKNRSAALRDLMRQLIREKRKEA